MRKALLIVFSLCTLMLLQPALATSQYEEDVDYEVLDQAQPTSNSDKIEVLEFFWYGCPHCYQFEPHLQRWKSKLSKDVEFIKIPAVFRPEWEIHARAYYTAQRLNVEDKISSAIFTAMHEQRLPMNNEAQLAQLFKQNGVSEADFQRTFKSFPVDHKVRRAKSIHRQYGVNSVPNMIVNGKYRTNASLVGNNTTVLKVVDYLIERERNR